MDEVYRMFSIRVQGLRLVGYLDALPWVVSGKTGPLWEIDAQKVYDFFSSAGMYDGIAWDLHAFNLQALCIVAQASHPLLNVAMRASRVRFHQWTLYRARAFGAWDILKWALEGDM